MDPLDWKVGTPADHVGVVAVVGRTNAGKSTLVNALVGEKVSIVTPVAQTTRSIVRAVLTEARGQIVFLDTPGLHQSKNLLGSEMNKHARAAAKEADAVLLMLDGARAPQLEDEGWMRRLVRCELPLFIVLNKCDVRSNRKQFEELWARAVAEDEAKEAEAAAREAARAAEPKPEKIPPWKRKKHSSRAAAPIAKPTWFSISAKEGEGMTALANALFSALPAGALLFDGDTLSDHPRKIAVGDIIREKFFVLLHDELPHSLGIRVEDIQERDNGTFFVKGTVLVRRSGQKGIVLGEKGRTLRSAVRAAERDLAEYFGGPTEVDLWIRVEENWDENYFLLRQLGYC